MLLNVAGRLFPRQTRPSPLFSPRLRKSLPSPLQPMKKFGQKLLFEDVNWLIHPGERAAQS